MAQRSAYLLGAERVVAIARFLERFWMARAHACAGTINFSEAESVLEALAGSVRGSHNDECSNA